MPISSQALRRRAKKYLSQHQIELYVPTLPGLEHVTATEVAGYAHNIRTSHGGVTFAGDLSTIYRANLSIRTGNRVLLRLGQFLAQSYPMLYDHARSIDWVAILGNCPEIGIHVASRESRLNHRNHVRDTIFSAIRDRMAKHSLEPKLAAKGPLTIHARLYRDRCALSLDTTGAHLHKRGYRTYTPAAPVRETTAAALLLMANAKEYDMIVDPFCGAGTFLIEAELVARNFPPGAHRSFAFESSPLHAPGTLRHTRRMLIEEAIPSTDKCIVGSDISREAVSAAIRNAAQASTKAISISHENALDLDLEKLRARSARALMVSNLPYGKRLGSRAEARDLLEQFCGVLARKGRGWNYVLLTPQRLFIRHPGLVNDMQVELMNGGLQIIATFGHVEEK